MTDDLTRLAERIAAGLTAAQRYEMRTIRDEDATYLARGDQAGLVDIGLAVSPPNMMGFYRLTPLGLAVRAHLQQENPDAQQG